VFDLEGTLALIVDYAADVEPHATTLMGERLSDTYSPFMNPSSGDATDAWIGWSNQLAHRWDPAFHGIPFHAHWDWVGWDPDDPLAVLAMRNRWQAYYLMTADAHERAHEFVLGNYFEAGAEADLASYFLKLEPLNGELWFLTGWLGGAIRRAYAAQAAG
jgi:hypothetical protein